MSTVREPQKVTSIEKKNRIIEAGLKAFQIDGYFKTNTAKIAKLAGVSTGIVYQYFNDKKDILVYAAKIYFLELYETFVKSLDELSKPIKIDNVIEKLIEASITNHKNHELGHEEMIAMSHLDEDVHKIFHEGEHKIIDKVIELLDSTDIKKEHVEENIHMIYKLIEDFSHERVCHNDNDLDYSYVKTSITNIAKGLLISKK